MSSSLGRDNMEELSQSLPQSYAFVYPWTQISGEDVDSIITGTILYDRLYYLDYKLPHPRKIPLFQGVEHLSDPKRIGYQGVLEVLSGSGRLAPLSAQKIRNSIQSSGREHHYKTFAKTCLENRDILRQKGFSSSARLKKMDTVYLADEKIDSTMRTPLDIPSPSSLRPGEIPTSWENVAAIIAAYADYVQQARNAVDIAKHCCDVFRRNHPKTDILQRDIANTSWVRGDCDSLLADLTLVRPDHVSGGSPCKGSSRRNYRKVGTE